MTWIVKIEIEFPVHPTDTTILYDGDADADFAGRALDRLHLALEAMRTQLDPEAHYYILQQPRRNS